MSLLMKRELHNKEIQMQIEAQLDREEGAEAKQFVEEDWQRKLEAGEVDTKEARLKEKHNILEKKRVLTKRQYVARVKRILASKKAQKVGSACAQGFRKTCKEMVRNKGNAIHG